MHTHHRLVCALVLAIATPLPTSTALADELPVLGPEMSLAEPSLTTRGGRQEAPDIACPADGRCLMVWTDSLLSNQRYDVMGAFMERDGRIGVPFLIAEMPDDYLLPASVATDGRDFVVAWSGPYSEVGAIRVRADGQLGDTLVLSSGQDYEETEIAATNDGRFLVVWRAAIRAGTRFNGAIHGAFIEPDDTVSPAFLVSDPVGPTAHDQRYPSIVSNGTRFLVTWVWQAPRFEGEPVRGEMRGILIDADGQLGEQLTFGTYDSWWWPASLVVDGDGFLAAWTTPRLPGDEFHDVVVARIDGDGAVSPGMFVLTRRNDVSRANASLGGDGHGEVLLTWTESADASPHQGALHAVARRADGTWTAKRVLRPDINLVYGPPAVAWRGDRYVITWSETRDTTFMDDVFALDVSASGTPLEDAPRLAAAGPSQHVPRVVALPDDRFLALWGEGNHALSTALIDAEGQVLEHDADALLDVNAWCVRAADDGARGLMTWSSWDHDETHAVWLDRDGRAGAPLTLTPLPDPGYGCAHVATDGDHFLVAWRERPEPSLQANDFIDAALVAPHAPSASTFRLATLPANTSLYQLTVSSLEGNGFLVGAYVLQDPTTEDAQFDVYAIRVDAHGQVDAPLHIATSEESESLDAIVADDTGFTVFWRRRTSEDGNWVWRTMATRVDLDGVAHEPRVVVESADSAFGFRGSMVRAGNDRIAAVWTSNAQDTRELRAAVLDGDGLPVSLDVDPPTRADEHVQLAWGTDRGLVVYSRDYRVYARTLAVERPVEPPPPDDIAVPTDTSTTPDATLTLDTTSPAAGADAPERVAPGCCSTVRRPPGRSDSTGWWAVLALLALVGLRRHT